MVRPVGVDGFAVVFDRLREVPGLKGLVPLGFEGLGFLFSHGGGRLCGYGGRADLERSLQPQNLEVHKLWRELAIKLLNEYINEAI